MERGQNGTKIKRDGRERMGKKSLGEGEDNGKGTQGRKRRKWTCPQAK